MSTPSVFEQDTLFNSYKVEEWTEHGGYKIAILWLQINRHEVPDYQFAIFNEDGKLIHKSLDEGGGYFDCESAKRFAFGDIERLLPDPNANPIIEFELVPGMPEQAGRYLFQLKNGLIIDALYLEPNPQIQYFDCEKNQFQYTRPTAWLKKISD